MYCLSRDGEVELELSHIQLQCEKYHLYVRRLRQKKTDVKGGETVRGAQGKWGGEGKWT